MSPPQSFAQPDVFRDRADAGDRLAEALRPHLAAFHLADIVVAGLARGGVIVAAEIARMLDVRLDVIMVRKLGAPNQPELAIGAITADGSQILNDVLIQQLQLTPDDVQQIANRAALSARALCRELGIAPDIPSFEGRTVVLVDDGMATGATVRAAIKSAYRQGARRVVVALPVAPDSAQTELAKVADDVVVLLAPRHLQSVGQWYHAFPEVSTEQVRRALQDNPWSSHTG